MQSLVKWKTGIAFSSSWLKIFHILLLPTSLWSENQPTDSLEDFYAYDLQLQIGL